MKPLILTVDDCEDDRLLITCILETLGYQNITIADGTAALQLTQHCHPALIFLDICMAGINGYEVLGHLKQTPQTAAIPVIAMAAMMGIYEQVLAAGFDGYLAKPFPIEFLEQILDRHLVKVSNSLSI